MVEYITKNFEISDSYNNWRTPISPIGIYKARICDKHSLKIYFVAVCRAFGIPARIEEGTQGT